MIYFDTDVLVNFAVQQDEKKHIEAQKIVFEAIGNNRFCISFLTLQEFLYVLERLCADKDVIDKNYSFFKEYATVGVDKEVFDRAYKIATKIGFRHINDCIHLAISEKYCQSLITYNKDDFKKIKKLSSAIITIL